MVAVGLDPDNANPLVAPYALSGMVIDLVQPGLVRRAVTEAGLTYEPALARSWAWSEGGTTLTYQLRDDLRWDDGRPVTSADVAFSYELMKDPAVASNWLGDANKIAGVDTPDPHTVVYRFTERRNPLLQQGYTLRGVVDKQQLEGADRATLRGHESARDPSASGPFRITSWKRNERLVLEPNPAAPADWQPTLSAIVLKIVPEYQTRLLQLLKGDVDLLVDLELGDLATVRERPDLRVRVQQAQSMAYFGYRLDDVRFTDRKVREALTRGLDRQGLIDKLFTVDGTAHAQPCIGTVGPTNGAWVNTEVQPLPFDPAAAAALLDEAGWTDTDGDGVRDKDGTPLRFALMVQNGSDQLKEMAVYAQAQWKAIGVAASIDLIDPTTFFERARNQQYDAMLWSFGNNPKVDPSIQWRSDGQYNWFGYANPEVDRLLDEATAATDLATAQQAVREVQALVHADQPVTFLVWQDGFDVVHTRFTNTQLNTFTNFSHAWEWGVE